MRIVAFNPSTMLTQTAEHALRALLFLAQRPEAGSVPADEIAEAIGAPRNYLSKTLNALARSGIVSGTRGPRGGFQLCVDPAELPIARVIDEFAPPSPHELCLLGGRRCNSASPCRAHGRWMRMWEESQAPLWNTTLADLLDPESAAPGITPLLVNR